MKNLSLVGKISLGFGIVNIVVGVWSFIQDLKKDSELMSLTLIIIGISLMVSASLYKKQE